MAGFLSKAVTSFKHAWNIFTDENYLNGLHSSSHGGSYFGPSSRTRRTYTTERSIIASIYNRISIDASDVEIKHVRVDDEGRYLKDIQSGLQNCLTVEANLDQSARHFRQDVVQTLIDKGCIAIVPVDSDINPAVSTSYDIQTLRVGEIVGWEPSRVLVNLYDEKEGIRKDIWVSKRFAAIVENPLYEVMNQQNSTLQRLIRKLNMLDTVDEQTSSGKLDLIIQLPYVIKSEARRLQAEQRRADIEHQLKGSQYGIAYTDGTEKVTQLNRPAENNLLTQIEYLTKQLYVQLGLTEEVMNGTADEKTMLNYRNRTIKPIVQAIVEAMKRTFLTKTARSQKQSIMYFRDPFSLVPMEQLAEITDKFTRNEVLTSNEIRAGIGFKPSTDPKADKLQNSNMPTAQTSSSIEQLPIEIGGDSQNGSGS